MLQLSRLSFILVSLFCFNLINKYEATWESLDARPLPQWYDNAKVGIFIHWGVYSVPSYGSEWFWTNWKNQKVPSYIKFMNQTQKPGFTYQDFAKDFTAELFNPDDWADIFADSGAKYVVLTSKHHEGYTLYPSSYSFSWNSVDVGPHRDIIKELSESIRKRTSMRFGLYYSLFEWFNRMYNNDKLHAFFKQSYVNSKVWPELVEMIDLFQPEVIWSDGDWEAPDGYWKSKEFLAWLYNNSPVRETVVTNDRWGIGTSCKHGDFYTCSDRFNPGVLQKHKWENAMTLDKDSWGHRADAKLEDYLTSRELIRELVTTVSCNGNLLVNVGPNKYGIIEPIFVERLRDMGNWLSVNGDAIYGSKPWNYQNEGKNIWYTKQLDQTRTKVFVIVLEYPLATNNISLLQLGKFADDNSRVKLLGFPKPIKFSYTRQRFNIEFPDKREVDIAGLTLAWTFEIDIPCFLGICNQ
ncbi:unnamed protein product [Diamesa tonsa]